MAESDPPAWRRLGRGLFQFRDSCNVYILRYGNRAVAVDFGTGSWCRRLGEIGVDALDHVVLTHLHRDQCCGLYREEVPGLTGAQVHVPGGDAHLTTAVGLEEFWMGYQESYPASFLAPRQPIATSRPDLHTDGEQILGPARFCSLATPGHSPGALSYIVSWHGRELAFCGDAVHAGGKLHQPYHLEWDHWTPTGALAAWYGLERLAANRIDLLLPAHGPVVRRRARECVQQTQKRVMDLVHAKGSIAAGEPARWLDVEKLPGGGRRVLPHLYAFGGNGYLLVSIDGREGLVFDPYEPDMPHLGRLLQDIGVDEVSATTATHYHHDHSNALNFVRQRYGARVVLHPRVVEPIRDRDRYDVPYLPTDSVAPDRVLPDEGVFRWGGHRLVVRSFPGQTWWHCAFDADIDGRRVLVSGDNFQPPTRWNGTGGFCAYNRSRFDGFTRSAAAALDIAPDIVCNGHSIIYAFAPSHYRRIPAWSATAEKAVRALCPSPTWLDDYDPRWVRWEPFVSRAVRGGSLQLDVVCRNHSGRPREVEVRPHAPAFLEVSPARRRARVPAGSERRLKFSVVIDGNAPGGRHLLAADLVSGGRLFAEACVALVDIDAG